MGIQTMLIVAGITKLIPLTGVAMPFVASGGSSMVSCMTAIGILLSFSIRDRKISPRIMDNIW
jgi:cell division protein FtsW